MKKRIKKGQMTFAELNIRYERRKAFLEKTGSIFYTFIIILMCVADMSNFFTSFSAIYDDDFIVFIVLSVVLAILIDQAPSSICAYLFRNDDLEISESKKKMIRAFITLSVCSIAALIAILFMVRFSIIPYTLQSEDNNVMLSDDAANSITLLWGSLAIATTIASFLYSAINTTIVLPALNKALNRKFVALAKLMRESLASRIDELNFILEESESDILIRHHLNLEVIQNDMDLIYSLYQITSDRTSENTYSIPTTEQTEHPKVTVMNSI